MNVASLENCKTLYELSGWDDTLLKHVVGERHASDFESPIGLTTVYNKTVGVYGNEVGCDECEGVYGTETIPAYGAGYLLRKLPDPQLETTVYNRWHCKWFKRTTKGLTGPMLESGFADTPEDALCLLAIELFKQGILSPEGNHK